MNQTSLDSSFIVHRFFQAGSRVTVTPRPANCSTKSSALSLWVVSTRDRPQWCDSHILWVASARHRRVSSMMARTMSIRSVLALPSRITRYRGNGLVRGEGCGLLGSRACEDGAGIGGRLRGCLLIGVPLAALEKRAG